MAWTTPTTRATGDLITASIWNTDIVNNLLAANAVGKLEFVVAGSGGNAVETVWQGGWLEWNGATVSRTTYSRLNTYLAGLSPAYPFGAGDGSTTFTLGSLRGRMPVALGAHTDVATLGNNDGQSDANRRPKHRTSFTDNGHSHNQQTSNGAGSTFTTSTNSSGAALQQAVGVTSTNTTGITIGTGNANDALDAPSYLVTGIWVVKF